MLVPSPPSRWRQLAWKKNRDELTLFRAAAGDFLPPFPPAPVVALAVLPPPAPGSLHGPLSVLTAVFFGTTPVQMPLIWSPLSQRQHRSAVIH